MALRKKLTRRKFFAQITVLSIGSMILGACLGKRKDSNPSKVQEQGDQDPEICLSKNREMPRDLVMKLLDQKADHYMQLSNNCAQSSFMALSDQFGIKGEGVVKALTPLPGIAERGETCGAVTGPLMVFGLIYGRGKDRLFDWDVYRDSLIPSGKFCGLFEKEFGSLMCFDIQQASFGRKYRLRDPEELKAFQQADATRKCSEVVRKAVRMAADIILNDPEASDER